MREQSEKKRRKDEAKKILKRKLEEGDANDDDGENDSENNFDPDDMMAPEDARMLAGISVSGGGGKLHCTQPESDILIRADSRKPESMTW